MTILNIVGLGLNFFGTLVVALSAGRYFNFVDVSIGALQTTIQTLLDRSSGVPVITGLDVHRQTAMRRSTIRLWCGLLLLAGGFAVQLIAFFVSIQSP